MARSSGSRGRGERARVAQSDLKEVVEAVDAVKNLEKALATAQSDANEAKKRRIASKEEVKKLNKKLEVAYTKAGDAKTNLIEAKLKVATKKAVQAKKKLKKARKYVQNLEEVIQAEEEDLIEDGQQLKEHRVVAVSNLKQIEALEDISFNNRVKVCGKGKAKKRLVREATYRGLRITEE